MMKDVLVVSDEILDSNIESKVTKKDKVIALFKFLEELGKLKQKVILNSKDYPWCCFISLFPKDEENIKIYYRDRVNDEDSDATNILLAVHKPVFQSCPEPDLILKEWLQDGWDDYRNKADIKEFIFYSLDKIKLSKEEKENNKQRIDEENNIYKELFTDKQERLDAYEAWLEKRNIWVDKQVLLAETRDFFSELYRISVELERDSETLELIVADGIIVDRDNKDISHPILTKRVKIHHDAINNVIYILDTDSETDIYSEIFQYMENIHITSINQLREELRDNDYHPLDRNELPLFLKKLIFRLSSQSIYSENGIPNGWQNNNRLLLYRNPCYILRKRMDGAIKAIAKINEYVSKTDDIPAPIGDIVDGGKVEIPEDIRVETLEEQLAAVGGESIDILLSKEANREQLEIAKRIERYNAVLVQGPPGTGKTHTIANLMGHFLAQGKSVLVTSHTQKALSVLKDKLAPEIQSLCVSLIDDSNVDMEKSIDGITNYMSQYNSFEIEKEKDSLSLERNNIIKDLAEVRRKIFSAINKECNSIVFNGEEISPSAAAAFVHDNSQFLSYIPGEVKLYEPLPLTSNELIELYRSNRDISQQDESEFKCDLPAKDEIMSPDDFETQCNALKLAEDRIEAIAKNHNLYVSKDSSKNQILVTGDFGKINIDCPKIEDVNKLREYIYELPKMELWMQYCAVDGKKGGIYTQRWDKLIRQIEDTCLCSEAVVAKGFGKKVEIFDSSPEYATAVRELENKYKQNGGKLEFFSCIINSKLKVGLKGSKIDGKEPQTAEDCELILQILKLKELREQCAAYWNELFGKHDIPQFYELDLDYQEQAAAKYIPLIKRYQSWFNNEYTTIVSLMGNVGLPCKTIFQYNPLDSEVIAMKKMLLALINDIPVICEILEYVISIATIREKLQNNIFVLQRGKRIHSDICKKLIEAINKYQLQDYKYI